MTTASNANWKQFLSAQQRAAVDFVKSSIKSLILTARAGCGKTHTVIRGILREIVESTNAEVLIVAYNNSAGREFKERIQQLAEETGNREFLNWKRVQAGTVHSAGFGVVRRWAPNVNVNGEKVRDICRALAGNDNTSIYQRELSTIKHLVSLGKQSAIGFLTGVRDRSAWYALIEKHGVNETMDEETTIDELVDAAIVVLERSFAMDREVIDFDDQILAPLVHKLKIWPKDFVIVDEAQDTNAARRALILAFTKPRTGRVFAVGDNMQAIYGFTGADADALDLIAAATGAEHLPLTVTYRCPKSVVREANALVPDLVAHENNSEGIVRRLALMDDQEDSDNVKPWYQTTTLLPTDAILCRNTKPLIETAYQLLADGIGCRVEGREIGEGLIKLATRWKRVKNLTVLVEKITDYRDREVAKWKAKENESRAQQIEDKCDALLAISHRLVSTGKNEVRDLVAWINAMFSDSKENTPVQVTTLCTIHKSKGREWDRVFFFLRDTTLPSPYAKRPWQLQQEHNLEYVGITRAKRELVFVD